MLHALVNTLRRQSVAAAELPAQLVHGDFRLGNICRNAAGRTVYLDFGFTALRPRIHDIAYALAFMLLVLKRDQTTESIDRDSFMQLIMAYESTCGEPLRKIERQALFPYAAAVPLYAAALDGFTEDPAGKLRSRLPFLRLSEWLLIHPMR